MHELSMAQGIINAVIETAESNNATEVNEVTIELGRLAMVNPEQLEFILGDLVENTILEDAKIVFEQIQNYLSEKIKENYKNKNLFYRLMKDLKYVEDAKRQVSLTPPMNLQSVCEKLSFKMLLS